MLTWYIIFCPFRYSLFLYLNCEFLKVVNIWALLIFPFFLWLLIGSVSFAFYVIIDVIRFKSIILLLVFYFICTLLSFFYFFMLFKTFFLQFLLLTLPLTLISNNFYFVFVVVGLGFIVFMFKLSGSIFNWYNVLHIEQEPFSLYIITCIYCTFNIIYSTIHWYYF